MRGIVEARRHSFRSLTAIQANKWRKLTLSIGIDNYRGKLVRGETAVQENKG